MLTKIDRNLQRFQIAEEIGHFLRTGLKLGHRWRITAGDLLDQTVGRLALGNIPQTGADSTSRI